MTSSGVMIQQSEIYNLDLDQWTIGPALRVGGHCMVTLNQDEVLITGGFRDNRITLTTTISYNLNNEGLPDQEMLKGNYMNPRMFHACGKIWLPDWNTYAAIMVGGLDQNGDEVTLTELYYPNIGQWVATTHLPGPLSYASAVNVYDRLLITGGLSGLTPMDLGNYCIKYHRSTNNSWFLQKLWSWTQPVAGMCPLMKWMSRDSLTLQCQ